MVDKNYCGLLYFDGFQFLWIEQKLHIHRVKNFGEFVKKWSLDIFALFFANSKSKCQGLCEHQEH